MWSNIFVLIPEWLRNYLNLVACGILGGLTYRVLMQKKTTLVSVVKSMFVSGFSGFVGGLLCKSLGGSIELSYVVSCILGFTGGFGILILVSMFARHLGLDVSDYVATLQDSVEHNDELSIISSLLKFDNLSSDEYSNFMKGDYTGLIRLHSENKITTKQLTMLIEWQKHLHKHTSKIIGETNES